MRDGFWTGLKSLDLQVHSKKTGSVCWFCWNWYPSGPNASICRRHSVWCEKWGCVTVRRNWYSSGCPLEQMWDSEKNSPARNLSQISSSDRALALNALPLQKRPEVKGTQPTAVRHPSSLLFAGRERRGLQNTFEFTTQKKDSESKFVFLQNFLCLTSSIPCKNESGNSETVTSFCARIYDGKIDRAARNFVTTDSFYHLCWDGGKLLTLHLMTAIFSTDSETFLFRNHNRVTKCCCQYGSRLIRTNKPKILRFKWNSN